MLFKTVHDEVDCDMFRHCEKVACSSGVTQTVLQEFSYSRKMPRDLLKEGHAEVTEPISKELQEFQMTWQLLGESENGRFSICSL
jgi:hypothetical protein